MFPKSELRQHIINLAQQVLTEIVEEPEDHVFDHIPMTEADYPFIAVAECFEENTSVSTRTLVRDNFIIHVFNYWEKTNETEKIIYELSKAIYENENSGTWIWSVTDCKSEYTGEYDKEFNMYLGHAVLDITLENS